MQDKFLLEYFDAKVFLPTDVTNIISSYNVPITFPLNFPFIALLA